MVPIRLLRSWSGQASDDREDEDLGRPGLFYWVKPQHLRRVMRFQEIELTEDYWKAQSWIFNAEQMYIRVTDGRPRQPGPEKEDFSDVVAANRK